MKRWYLSLFYTTAAQSSLETSTKTEARDDITVQSRTGTSAAVKSRLTQPDKANRQRETTLRTQQLSKPAREHLERCTKGEFIGLSSIVRLTFFGRAVCPICAGKGSLIGGPRHKPWDISRPSQTSLSVYLCAMQPLNSSGMKHFRPSVNNKTMLDWSTALPFLLQKAIAVSYMVWKLC